MANDNTLQRRGFLKRLATLGSASVASLLATKSASAQMPTTMAVGEEGPTRPNPGPYPGSRPTTLAVGEEGQPPATTLMVGEETNCVQPPRPTTMRFGEEGQPPATTLAHGEEGQPPATTRAIGEEGSYPVTTRRTGEEAPQPNNGRPHKVTTMMAGEEGQPFKFGPHPNSQVTPPRQWNGFQRW